MLGVYSDLFRARDHVYSVMDKEWSSDDWHINIEVHNNPVRWLG